MRIFTILRIALRALAPEQDAHRADDAGHGHWCRRGHRVGQHHQRRQATGGGADCQPGRKHVAHFPRFLQFQRRAAGLGQLAQSETRRTLWRFKRSSRVWPPSARKTAPAPRSLPAIRTGTPASWANPPSISRFVNGLWPKAKCSATSKSKPPPRSV